MEEDEELLDRVEDENADTFNDETFGAFDDGFQGKNLPDFFKTSDSVAFESLEGNDFEDHPPGQLPAFFSNQQNEHFYEEPLESLEDITQEEDDFHRSLEDNFFFSAKETEENQVLDTQMKDLEKVFKLSLLDDQENELPEPVSQSLPISGNWSSPGNQNIWANSPQQPSPVRRNFSGREQIASSTDEIIVTPPRNQSAKNEPQSPLSKFFPNAGDRVIGLPPPQSIPKAMSVTELEAQLTKQNRNSPQVSPPTDQPKVVSHQQRTHYSQVSYQQQNNRFQQTSKKFWSTNDTTTFTKQHYKNNEFYRPRWRESKQRMKAHEIESIIQIQEFQLQSGNPYAEDYYFQNLKAKQKAEQFVLHKPLFETYTTNKFNSSNRKNQFEGALGRIPSHSVRAPRPLLQLDEDSSEGLSSHISSIYKTTYNLLITIENAYNELLDTEDIDSILKKPESNEHFNMSQLKQKREELTNALFKSLQVYVPQPEVISHAQKLEGQQYLFPQDETFINFMLVQKGKRLLVRTLPLLFQNHIFAIFFVFMRNLGIVVTSPRLQMDINSTNKIFYYLHSIINDSSIGQIIGALQMILRAHNSVSLLQILQSRYGMTIIQALFKRGHDLHLSSFSREQENMLPREIVQQLAAAGSHWKTLISALFQILDGRFTLLFTGENVSGFKVWEFLAVLIINLNQRMKEHLIHQLREIIQATPMNQPLQAFLHLAGELKS